MTDSDSPFGGPPPGEPQPDGFADDPYARIADPAEPPPEVTVIVGDETLTITEATARVHRSANWFWWIAGLSLVNTIFAIFGVEMMMLFGLGFSAMADAFFMAIGNDPDFSMAVVRPFHLVIVAGATGTFYFLGVKARALRLWAFWLGMAIYTLDMALFLIFEDWIAAAVHAWVLFVLFGGAKLAKSVVEAERQAAYDNY